MKYLDKILEKFEEILTTEVKLFQFQYSLVVSDKMCFFHMTRPNGMQQFCKCSNIGLYINITPQKLYYRYKFISIYIDKLASLAENRFFEILIKLACTREYSCKIYANWRSLTIFLSL